MKNSLIKTIEFIILLALAFLIEYADMQLGTGETVILYLIPVVLATIYLGLPYGLILSIISVSIVFFGHYLTEEVSYILLTDIMFHFIVFASAAIFVDYLMKQLTSVKELEQKRHYDLSLAREVHQSVFAPVPKENAFLTIGNRVAFSKELGGDYYYLADMGDRLFYCIADISGKSIAAALFSALLHDAVINSLEDQVALVDIIGAVNGRLYTALPEDVFITMFCAFIEPERIKYINAGHEPPLLYSAKQKQVGFLLGGASLPLGIHPFPELTLQEQYFASGDILLAVTDGVTDSDYYRKNPFRMLQADLENNTERTPKDIVDEIFAKSSGPAEYPTDDIIITCMKRK